MRDRTSEPPRHSHAAGVRGQSAPARPALPPLDLMRAAVEKRDGAYDGVFVFAVRTTGVFCRPSCPSRRARPENVEFFLGAGEAIDAGYRPCRRCRPLEDNGTPAWLRSLLERVEQEPGARLTDADLRADGLDPVRVRRWFRRRYGMTFHAYCRARRLAAALGRLRAGDELLHVAFDGGYESLSGFRDAFRRLFGRPPGRARHLRTLYLQRLDTPLGPMLAGAADEGICLLEFHDRARLDRQLRALQRHLACVPAPGGHAMLERLAAWLQLWFAGGDPQQDHAPPVLAPGTPWQERVWRALREIPPGSTRSYGQLAAALGRPTAARAVAHAVARNRVAILLPCHRVIAADGTFGGYAGGVWRKRALLALEAAGPDTALGPTGARALQAPTSGASRRTASATSAAPMSR